MPLSFIEFALKKVIDYTLSRDHEDIDVSLNSQADSSDEQWTLFIEQFILLHSKNLIHLTIEYLFLIKVQM